jgi:hypothetical protein
MTILRWLLSLLTPRTNMNIATELVNINRLLTGVDARLGQMEGRFNSLEQGHSQIMDAIAAHGGATGIVERLDRQEALLKDILAVLTLPPAAKVIFTIRLGGNITEGATKVKIKDNQEFDVAVAFQDSVGNPATVEGAPTWTSDNETVLTLTPSADGLSAVVSAAGPVGTAQISVSADADLGAGTTTITGVLDVEVIAGDAALIVLNPGPARDKVAPEPTPPSA